MQIPKTEIMLTSADLIHSICEPLTKLNISLVSYVRAYENGYKIDLNNAPTAAEHMYYQTNLIDAYYPEMEPEKSPEYLYINSQQEKSNPMLCAMREKFNLDHYLVITQAFKNYYEIWSFGTDADNYAIMATYLNELPHIKQFKLYFREQAMKPIKQFLAHPFKTKVKFNIRQPTPKPDIINRNMKIRLDHDTTISAKEKQCLELLAQGHPCKTIGHQLNIGQRTVETHLANLRTKLHCKRNYELIRKAAKENII